MREKRFIAVDSAWFKSFDTGCRTRAVLHLRLEPLPDVMQPAATRQSQKCCRQNRRCHKTFHASSLFPLHQ
ncbi:hypothetical protein GPEL0_01r1697 [Geoanaerobacter pelophilus]|uniref:Uncharacterized protein n=1 Tax=Geoanaerobacter pelophilus TaxID=60036 RepID=A0ABQ0MH03_9BACT|nr:hypothetical protein GPEL0_01r1697 [Geoanaerobacter pelophilus]